MARPLTEFTKTDVPLVFSKACWDAIEELKFRLTSAPLLRHYVPEYECMIETDALDGVVAGVLSQLHPDGELVPSGLLETMLPAKCNYEIHDKEILTIIRSLEQ